MLVGFYENRQALRQMDYERSVYEFSAKKPKRDDHEILQASLPELTASDFMMAKYLCEILGLLNF